MYQYGRGVPRDYTEAVKLYRLSAAQGNANGQVQLGVMYALGHGVPQDYVKAHLWANLAGAKGNEMAVRSRDSLAKVMTSQQIAEAHKLARDCLARNLKGCD
jgi:TPR repeat protein